jgi:hypothetical protein
MQVVISYLFTFFCKQTPPLHAGQGGGTTNKNVIRCWFGGTCIEDTNVTRINIVTRVTRVIRVAVIGLLGFIKVTESIRICEFEP